MSQLIYKKPVVCIFKERAPQEIDPFVVVKAKQLQITRVDGSKSSGIMEDFFTLMGDADYLLSPEGKADHFVMCWFDDTEPDMTRDLRRLQGVTFAGQVTCALNEKNGKRTYNASFKAEHSKLK